MRGTTLVRRKTIQTRGAGRAIRTLDSLKQHRANGRFSIQFECVVPLVVPSNVDTLFVTIVINSNWLVFLILSVTGYEGFFAIVSVFDVGVTGNVRLRLSKCSG